ncbi:MAG TPA: hypothetical protein VJ464_13485 [Blastocatellia bacterium]|nr:hypothetical protein [Blastocatellia bacterium]
MLFLLSAQAPLSFLAGEGLLTGSVVPLALVLSFSQVSFITPELLSEKESSMFGQMPFGSPSLTGLSQSEEFMKGYLPVCGQFYEENLLEET